MQPCIEYETARGLLVPLEDINPQYVLMSEEYPWEQWYAYLKTCRNNELTTQKGRMAVNCVTNAIRMNKFPLWVCGHINNDREIDIQGTDIIVSASRRIQVKYDERAYPRIMGGSGNLFIQTHECNPMKNY